MAKPQKIIVFASGAGSNFKSICEAVKKKKLSAQIIGLISDHIGVRSLEVAREYGISAHAIERGRQSREEHEAHILNVIHKDNPDWIILAGYMRIFSKNFIDRFFDEALGVSKIINIHPSLLPAFPGKDGYLQALRYGVKVTGATVHFVSQGVDDGPIIAQRSLLIEDSDTESTLKKRGLALEHELYVESLQQLFTKPWKLSSVGIENARKRVVFENT